MVRASGVLRVLVVCVCSAGNIGLLSMYTYRCTFLYEEQAESLTVYLFLLLIKTVIKHSI